MVVPVEADGSGRERTFKIEIKYQGTINLSSIGDYVKENSKTPWDGSIQNNLTVLNAFANSKVRSEYLSVGRKAVFPPPCDNKPIYLSGAVKDSINQ